MGLKIGDMIELKEITGQKCVVTKIVEGGSGVVYFLDTTTLFPMPKIVMKIIKNISDIENAYREARLWSKIGHHKNIASFICCGLIDEQFYILSKRYYRSLDALSKNEMNDDLLIKILIGIIDGLLYANKQVGLIHRDIKPHNIFIDDNYEPKIGDFGLSSYIKNRHILSSDFKNIYSKLTVSSQLGLGGTIPYMAPELLSPNPKYNIGSDIYSVGVSLFNVITNMNFPYNLPDFTINEKSFLDFKNCNISSLIKNIIIKCINIDYEKRYKSYNEIYEELKIKPEESYEPSLRDYIDNIQTARRTKQYSVARLKLNEAIDIFKENPNLINQKAVLEKEEKGIEEAIIIYEKLFSDELHFKYEDYIECLFNLAAFYFETGKLEEIVPFISKFEYLITDMDSIQKEYIEYGIYLGLKKEYQKAFKCFQYYCSTHLYNDYHLVFFMALSYKVNKIDDFIKVIRSKNSNFNDIVLSNYLNNDINTFIDFIKYTENQFFGGI